MRYSICFWILELIDKRYLLYNIASDVSSYLVKIVWYQLRVFRQPEAQVLRALRVHTDGLKNTILLVSFNDV